MSFRLSIFLKKYKERQPIGEFSESQISFHTFHFIIYKHGFWAKRNQSASRESKRTNFFDVE